LDAYVENKIFVRFIIQPSIKKGNP